MKFIGSGLFGLLTVFFGSAVPGSAAEYPSAVSSFNRVCLTQGTNPSDRVTAVKALTGWTLDDNVTVDVRKLAISKSMGNMLQFPKPVTVEQWSGPLDGRSARFVFASFPAKAAYPNLCALVFEDATNAMSYSDELGQAFKQFGIKGKSVDLVHYFEYSGKIGAEKHSVRGEIFTRSIAGQNRDTAHIYVAY